MNRTTFDQHLQANMVFRHAQQFYGHAYESPIEERLAWHLSKFLAPSVILRPQVGVQSQIGSFRADMILHAGEVNTVLECDGKAFHQDSHRDLVRDAAMLDTNLVDQVIRFRGEDLYAAIYDVMYLVVVIHPQAFNDRGRVMLRRMASEEIRDLHRPELFQKNNLVVGHFEALRAISVVIHAPGALAMQTPAAQAVVRGLRDHRFETLAQAVEQTRAG